MARHRKQKKNRWRPQALLVGTTAVAMSSAVAAGHLCERLPRDTAAELLAYVYGVGGSSDSAGVNIPVKLSGELIGAGDSYHPIVYPAGIPVDPSVEDAIPTLYCALTESSCEAADGLPDGESAVVVGYSEGAIVVEYMRRMLEKDPTAPDPEDLQFIQIAGPSVPNGGIYARFTIGIIPGFTTTGPTQPSKYNTTYVTVEYDTVADFPAYFNPLAIANSLVAFFSTHADPSYNAADIYPSPRLTTTIENSAEGIDTYVFIPVEQLQILWPIRLIAERVGATPFTEPVLGLIEPTLRVLIDMGYTDRENLHPEQHVPFSLFTPPENVAEALAAMPGAFEEGLTNFEDGISELIEPQDDAETARVDQDGDNVVVATAETEGDEEPRDPRPGIRPIRLLADRVGAAVPPGARSAAAQSDAEESELGITGQDEIAEDDNPDQPGTDPDDGDDQTQAASQPSSDEAPAA
ncbi:MAG: PE-PPE domain-containing protein [Mycobacterium sp.]